jgi:hypothetical protein
LDETAPAVETELSFEIKAKGDEPPRPRSVTVSVPMVAVTAVGSLTTAPVVGFRATVAVAVPTAKLANTFPFASKFAPATPAMTV